jgi:hypothetical protein
LIFSAGKNDYARAKFLPGASLKIQVFHAGSGIRIGALVVLLYGKAVRVEYLCSL